MNKRKKLLILGASGFIGSSILKSFLKEEDYDIAVLQHNKALESDDKRIQIIKSSIGRLDFNKLPFEPDTIIHAARNNTGRFGSLGRLIQSCKGYIENRRLLSSIRKLKSKPVLIYCSGSLMYGSHPGKIIDESFPLNPSSFARQYYIAELPIINAIKKQQAVMIRLPWVIGKGSWFQWNFIKPMTSLGTVPLYGEGNNVMTFVDVDIIGDAIKIILRTNFTGLINLFNPELLYQKDWVTLLSEISGKPVKKLSPEELNNLPVTVQEAFSTEIALGSMHKTLQQQLAALHNPLKEIVNKHLSMLKDK